jgi:hypothetical protein
MAMRIIDISISLCYNFYKGMNGIDGGGVSQIASREAPNSLTQRTYKCQSH